MRHLIISDIHSNLEALQAVLGHATGRGYDAVICLGDFVGYGADPDECVQIVAGLDNASAVLGNHDAAVINPAERGFFNPVARAGILYSEENLTRESELYLRQLPMTIDSGGDFLAVHASPYHPEAWIYVIEPVEASEAFHVIEHAVAFIGHTHFPAVHTHDGVMRKFEPGQCVTISDDNRVIINVGSVGQPRDNDPRAAYVMFDDQAKTVEIFRVSYDIDTAGKKILDAGLPPVLAHRLHQGF